MSDPTPASIAAKLTEAQREVLLRPIEVSSWAFYPARAHMACRALAALGLLTETADSIGNPMFAFAPKGLAVRAILQETEREG